MASQPKKDAKPYDAAKDSNDIYKAMHGGLTGMGTDEESLFRTLDGKTKEQLDSLRSNYKDHYGRNLDDDIKKELSGGDLQRAENLLKGNNTAADANALRNAMSGMGTDENAIYEKLQGKSAEERAAIQKEYKNLYGTDLSNDMKKELSGNDLIKADALLKGDQSKADAANLRKAMSGMGTDEDAIYKTMEGKNADERAAIQKAYRETYGRELTADFKGEMKNAELDRASALLEGKDSKAHAAEIRNAMAGMGTDEKGIQNVLEGKTEAERAEIKKEYKAMYGKELQDDLKSEMSGNDLSKTGTLLEKGKLTDAEKLHYAVDGAGTDENAIRETLTGRTKEEIAQIRDEYKQKYDRDLFKDLSGDLSGRDRFDIGQELKGRPTTAEEALKRTNETHDYERKGIKNFIGSKFVDVFSDKGKLLDSNTKRANEFYKTAMSDGKMDEAEKKRFSELTGFVSSDVETYREAKDSAADTAATVATTAAAVAVTVGTAGTGTPLGVAMVTGAAAGAGARVMTKAAISGKGYGWEDKLGDLGIGAVDGGVTVLSAGAGQLAAKTALHSSAKSVLKKASLNQSERMVEMASAEILERSAAKKIAIGAIDGMTDGVIGGSISSGAATALNDETWNDGLGKGLARVGTSSATGAVLGAGTGALISGGFSAKGTSSHLIDESKLVSKHRMGANEWQTYGDFDEMVEINKAFEATPQKVEFLRADGSKGTVDVYGAKNAQELKKVYNAAQTLQETAGDRATNALKEVHIRSRVGDMLQNGQKDGGSVAGLGGTTDGQIVLARKGGLNEAVVYHEVGHNLDAEGYWFDSGNKNSIFGKGNSVSAYAGKNSAEDFAETHRELIENWDLIKKDPDRYIHQNGDIGQKFKHIMEGIYGQKIPDPKIPEGGMGGIFGKMGGGGNATGIMMNDMLSKMDEKQLKAFFEQAQKGGMGSMMGGMGGGGMGGIGGGMMGNMTEQQAKEMMEKTQQGLNG